MRSFKNTHTYKRVAGTSPVEKPKHTVPFHISSTMESTPSNSTPSKLIEAKAADRKLGRARSMEPTAERPGPGHDCQSWGAEESPLAYVLASEKTLVGGSHKKCRRCRRCEGARRLHTQLPTAVYSCRYCKAVCVCRNCAIAKSLRAWNCRNRGRHSPLAATPVPTTPAGPPRAGGRRCPPYTL